MRPIKTKAGRIFMASGQANKDWQSRVTSVAMDAWKDAPLLTSATFIEMIWVFSRPKCHYRTGKNAHILRDDAPKYPDGKPDTDKLRRAIFDALTGVIWDDDCRAVKDPGFKRWAMEGEKEGCLITIEPL